MRFYHEYPGTLEHIFKDLADGEIKIFSFQSLTKIFRLKSLENIRKKTGNL